MDLARLTVRLEAQSAQLLTELEKANKKIDRFASSTNDTLKGWASAVAAYFTVDAIVSFTKGVLEANEHIGDLATATNVSVERLSGLGYAASQSGSDLDTLADALQKLASKSADVAAGSKTAKAAFDAIGVSALKLDGTLKSSDELLLDVADGFAMHADGAEKAAVAQDIFGKGGQNLIQFLNQGSAGIEALTDKAAKLGLIMSSETAAAADEFGDNLATLSSVVSQNLGAALAQVLPQLIAITNAIIAAISTGDGVSRFATAVTTAFRLITDVGYSVFKTFEDIGRGIGAFSAYVVQVVKGDLAAALEISKQYDLDRAASAKAGNEFLTALWDDSAKKIVASATAADEQLKKTIVFGGKAEFGELEEVKITLKKIDTKPVDDLYKQLQLQTQTQQERQIAAYDADLTALKVLLGAKQINVEKYNERLAEIQDTLLPEFEVTLKKIEEVAEKAVVELSEFEKQAASNTQDIIANTLTGIATGADISAKSILKSFGQMIIQLTAQAVAADLAGKLFGEAGGGTKGTSGWIGLAMGALGFGGPRDSGGRGMPGMEYAIGTGAQPERFVPDRPGTFIPADAGGTQVTNHFTVQTEQPVTRRTQMQIAAAASRGVTRAARRNN